MSKSKYVDGFLLVVPKEKLSEYKKMAKYGERVWRKHGCLDYKECVGDDMYPSMEGMPSLIFPKLAKAKDGEVIIFSYITYKSKSHRDSVNKKVMEEMSKKMEKEGEKAMPWDMKRFSYGGFKVIVG